MGVYDVEEALAETRIERTKMRSCWPKNDGSDDHGRGAGGDAHSQAARRAEKTGTPSSSTAGNGDTYYFVPQAHGGIDVVHHQAKTGRRQHVGRAGGSSTAANMAREHEARVKNGQH